MKLVITLSLAALAFSAVTSVNAQGMQEVVVAASKAPGTQVHSKTVNFADLDLSKAQALKALLSRIRTAAGEVCSPAPAANDMAGSKDYRACVSSAVNGAVAKIDNPGLSALAH